LFRQVASDINEKAFFGKKMRQTSAATHKAGQLVLSPRSTEINSIIQKIKDSFLRRKDAPVTDISFYRVGKMLGRGAFGKVNLAMHKLVRKLVALKSLNKEILTDKD
jgi:serine/threonine protein kinase